MIPWDQIQIRWIQGESASAISKSLGNTPTRQGISKRARKDNWKQLPTVSNKHYELSHLKLGQDTPNNRQAVMDMLSEGVSYTLAAGVIGVSRNTLLAWRQKDPGFAAQCQSARHSALANCAKSVYQAKDRDWKASKYLLETAKESHKDYNSTPKESGRINVTFNIRHSDAVSIEGETVDGEYEVITDIEDDAA